MRTHDVTGGGGLRLHVREWGKADGPLILFIHGWSQYHLSWAAQYESPLTEEFRLVALDLRGHGMSEKPLEAEHYVDARLRGHDQRTRPTASGPRRMVVRWVCHLRLSAGLRLRRNRPSTSLEVQWRLGRKRSAR
jgi:pimeloyl-ACP methyl ester carboxylesterase